jgi:hypothetical protein
MKGPIADSLALNGAAFTRGSQARLLGATEILLLEAA